MRVEDPEVTGQIHEGAELQPTKGPIRIPAALSALRPVLLRDMRNKRIRRVRRERAPVHRAMD